MFFCLDEKEIKKPQIVAHRGGCGELKQNENRISSYQAAKAADFWETDLRLTSDGIIVLVHDDMLDGRLISEYKAEDLKGRIDTLDQLLEIKPPEVGLLLDIKGQDLKIISALEDMQARINEHNIILICFNHSLFKERLPREIRLLF